MSSSLASHSVRSITVAFGLDDQQSKTKELRLAFEERELAYADTPFVGLAPFLRLSHAGVDLRPLSQEMLDSAGRAGNDANLWMNLSTAMLCLGLRDVGLAIQAQALEMQRVYSLAATEQPAKLRLLMLMMPGDLAANTPIDCLLEGSDVDLCYYYVAPGAPLADPIPEHDVLMVAMSDSDENRIILALLEDVLAQWPQPVINLPQHIPRTGRDAASALLQNVPGLRMPPTRRVTRLELEALAQDGARLPALLAGGDFPIILRPVGSHAGRDLDRIYCPEEIPAYLAKVQDAAFFLSEFIDYSHQDGLFRKFRIVLIDGMAFACHMAVSSHWIVHYVNAGMMDDAQKRSEEATFMMHFDDFAQRHQSALDAIHKRTQLDYLCIDCAETRDGQLLIFEIDHDMIVHAMDSEDLFPYKQLYMRQVKDAFRAFLLRLMADQASKMSPLSAT